MTPQHPMVLFICTANICRSPMAEYLLRARQGEDGEWAVQSAGVSAFGGLPASREAVAVMAELKIDLQPHASQPLTRELAQAADLIVPMTRAHRDVIVRMSPDTRERVRLLRSFGPDGSEEDIEDPIGLSTAGYRTIRNQIDSAISDLVLHLRGLRPTHKKKRDGDTT